MNRRSERHMVIWLLVMGIFSFCSHAFAEKADVQIAEVKNNCKAIVTVISDDGVFETGCELNELAKKHDLRMTVAGYVRNVKNHLSEWQAIVDEGHIELVSHSWNHQKMSDETSVSDDQYYTEIFEAKMFYETNFGYPQIGFVCPNNTMTERGYEFLNSAGYYAVRRGCRGENSLNPLDTIDAFGWDNLGVRGIGDVNSTSERNEWIDSAIRNRTWLIEMWHDVSPEGGERYHEIATEMADEHLSYIAAQKERGNIWVATYQEAIKYLWEKEHATVEVKNTDNEMTIILSCDRERLPKEVFNDPLTLLVDVPSDWKYVFAVQNGFSLPVERDALADRIKVNVIPDGNKTVIRCIKEEE